MTTGRRNAWLAHTLAVLSLVTGLAGAASAQHVAGTLAGAVLDAETGRPLAGAAVSLEPQPVGVLPGHEPGDSPFLRATRSTTTAEAGEYRFTELAAGTYRLRFSRLGYRSASLEVELRGSGGSRVSVGLSVEPVRLEPLEVTSAAANPFGRAGTSATPESRAAVELERQERYLASDVRAVTRSDVIQSVTLAETDLFRAVQRLPGVSGRDIWSAELWTRGAPWDQTRIYFDGMPLFNPVHGLGLFSGVNPDAIGAAFLHPGVQPASLGGGAAGALELHSRRGAGDGAGGVSGMGELSLMSGRLEVEQQRDSGRVAWMAAVRRTYLDVLTGAIARLEGSSQESILPYAFDDVTFRLDHPVGRSSALEVSATGALDEISVGLVDIDQGSTMSWGGGAARATITTPFGGLESRHTLGFSGFASGSRGAEPDAVVGTTSSESPVAPVSNHLVYASLAGELAPSGDAGAPWRAGYELIAEGVRYDGISPTPYAVFAPGLVPDTSWSARLFRAAVWTELRGSPTPRLTWDAGLRLEAGAGGLRAVPRLSTRLRPTAVLGLSATLGRSYQYEQAFARGGAVQEHVLSSDVLWTLAGGDAPVIRADEATLGGEWWLDPRWLTSATVYVRHTAGVLVPDPTPGVLPVGWPRMLPAGSDGRGLELSLRRLTGRWTGSLAYTLARTEMETAELRYPAPGDRLHELDATLLTRLGRWELGGAYSLTSGAPYTRNYEGLAVCAPLSRPGACAPEWVVLPSQETPGAHRGRTVSRLDLLASWNRSTPEWALSVYLQIHNALLRNPENWGAHKSSHCYRPHPVDYETPCTGAYDDFLNGPPVLPVVGARFNF